MPPPPVCRPLRNPSTDFLKLVHPPSEQPLGPEQFAAVEEASIGSGKRLWTRQLLNKSFGFGVLVGILIIGTPLAIGLGYVSKSHEGLNRGQSYVQMLIDV